MSLDVFRKIFNSIDNHFTTRDLPLGLPLISGVGSFVKLLTATMMMIGIVNVQISVPSVDIQQLKSNEKKGQMSRDLVGTVTIYCLVWEC